jgi:hypothetical protein
MKLPLHIHTSNHRYHHGAGNTNLQVNQGISHLFSSILAGFTQKQVIKHCNHIPLRFQHNMIKTRSHREQWLNKGI